MTEIIQMKLHHFFKFQSFLYIFCFTSSCVSSYFCSISQSCFFFFLCNS